MTPVKDPVQQATKQANWIFSKREGLEKELKAKLEEPSKDNDAAEVAGYTEVSESLDNYMKKIKSIWCKLRILGSSEVTDTEILAVINPVAKLCEKPSWLLDWIKTMAEHI